MNSSLKIYYKTKVIIISFTQNSGTIKTRLDTLCKLSDLVGYNSFGQLTVTYKYLKQILYLMEEQLKWKVDNTKRCY